MTPNLVVHDGGNPMFEQACDMGDELLEVLRNYYADGFPAVLAVGVLETVKHDFIIEVRDAAEDDA
ncbi:MAG: hypothetical protein AAGB11_14105 [Pseudomonadota bacterium]